MPVTTDIDPARAQRWADMAEELAGVGYWWMDAASQAIRWSPNMFRIFGVEPTHTVSLDYAMQFVHPEDRAGADSSLQHNLSGKSAPTVTRIVRPSGEIRHVEGRNGSELNAEGEVVAVYGTLLDVTERKLAEQALGDSEARYRLLANAATDVVVQMDAANLIQYVSPSVRRYGYAPDDLVGTIAAKLVHPDDALRVREVFASLVAGNAVDQNRDRSFRMRCAHGAYVWMEGNPAVIRNGDGRAQALVTHLRDISERRAADEAIAQSEARYRLLADAASDLVVKINANDVIEYVSPSIKRYGWAPEDMVGKLGTSFIHPEDVSRILARVVALAGGEADPPPTDRSYRMLRGDGRYAWIETNSSVVREADGSVRALICQTRDVSERRAAMQALAESEARYRVIAENVADVISRASLDGKLFYLSPSALAVTGFAPDELIGASMARLIHPEDRARVLGDYLQILADDWPSNSPLVYRARHKAGHWISIEASPTVIRDSSGAPVEFLSLTRDVSARVKLEGELLAASEAANAATAIKSNFLANMSHEIRTPLTAILGFTSLLSERTDLDAAARTHVHRVSSAGEALLSIVNDVLDFSRLEAGQCEIRPDPTSVFHVLDDVVGMFGPQAKEKQLELLLDCKGDVPATVLADKVRVRQVLMNLIGNALKFTEQGSIAVRARYDHATSWLRVEVEDTGPGLSTDQQTKLFQRFSQVDGTSTRKHGGTGLGLAICKGLVDAMGGEIGVTSQPGRGATFFFGFEAPADHSIEVTPPVAEPSGLDGLRILVVDDNANSRELVRILLTSIGAEVSEAGDGIVAVTTARAMPCDAILMDVRMPGLGGAAALRQIRDHHGPNQFTPILAFSADLEMDAADAALFDGVIAKPLVPAQLISVLAGCLSDDSTTSEAARESR